MKFKDEQKRSLLPKMLLLSSLLIIILVSSVLMFTDVENISSLLEPYEMNGNFSRHILLVLCMVVYFVRLVFTVFVLLKRTFGWGEATIVTFLMSFALLGLARAGGSNVQPVGLVEIIGMFLYISGSYLNTQSEYTRYIWKKDPKNKGRLYTAGLFKYSMHINYFGDSLLFTGFVLVAHSFTLLLIPLFMTLNFMFFIIPRLDKYLKKKYGSEFDDYAAHTKKLFPYIY